MVYPLGYTHPSNKVCQLCRALFGLKEAHCAWYFKFSSTIESLDFKFSTYDHALFVQCIFRGYIMLLLYVDDLVIAGDDYIGIFKLKQYLGQQFEIKDFGRLSYLLGLEVHSNLYFTKKYITDLITRVELADNKVTTIPIETNAKFNTKDETPLDFVYFP